VTGITEEGQAEEQPADEERRKRSRGRLRVKRKRDDVKDSIKEGVKDSLKESIQAAWPVSGGLTITGIGIGAIFVVLGWWLFHQQKGQVEIPDLVGKTSIEAEARLADAGLKLGSIHDEVSSLPPGTVLRIDPAAGTKLDRGAGVNLIVAAPVLASGGSPITQPPSPGAQQQPYLQLQLPAYPQPQPQPQPYPQPQPQPQPQPEPQQPPPSSSVFMGAGRVDYPDPTYHDCAKGYRFNFSQEISMTQPGRVTLRLIRSDGASAPVGYVDFPNPGTQVVRAWWQMIGGPGSQLAGWLQFEILTPQAGLTGQRISFSYTCPDPKSRPPITLRPTPKTTTPTDPVHPDRTH
jgi:PASTA domain